MARLPDSRVPPADACVLRPLLERWSSLQPDKVFVKVSEAQELTYREMRDLAATTAAGLQSLGVRRGDTVVVWMPNTLDCLRVWFAINWLGAVYVPINTAYKGRLLEHVLENAGASVIVAHAELADLLAQVDTAIETVVVLGGEPRPIGGLRVLPASVLDQGDAAALPDVEIEPWDLQSIIYTSGTTGPSKGVMSSYAHLYAAAGPDAFHMLTPDDRYLCNLPLCHVGGTIAVMGMLARGGSVALVSAFSTEGFWRTVRETGATFALLLGAMTTFLVKRPPGPRDRDHGMRKVVIAPLAEDTAAFAERFAVEVYTLYNMTEISTPIVSGPSPRLVGSCGKARRGVQLRLVDGNDCEVQDGEAGELVLRTDAPWALNSGYFKDPEATAAAWRNGWFHTGDAFRQEADGTYVFVDRMKDAIRRRGENISSFEVEAEVAAHPSVNEAAVVAVSSELSEDEVMCVVAPVPGRDIDPVDLIGFLTPRLPHFMVPRYVRIVNQLPKTPTQKVHKHLLRSAGVTEDTWDREASGITLRRRRLS